MNGGMWFRSKDGGTGGSEDSVSVMVFGGWVRGGEKRERGRERGRRGMV